MNHYERRLAKRVLWRLGATVLAAGLYIFFYREKGPDDQEKRDRASSDAVLKALKQDMLQDRPITISGMTIDGKSVTTADWKGKVVLVYFWSASRGLSVTDLPPLAQLYADDHSQGLEVLGVTGDPVPEQKFQSTTQPGENTPWPQLVDYEPDKTTGVARHPIADRCFVQGEPTVILIDKNGICRTIDTGDSVSTLLPKLMAE